MQVVFAGVALGGVLMDRVEALDVDAVEHEVYELAVLIASSVVVLRCKFLPVH
jgi:hypothetical protein